MANMLYALNFEVSPVSDAQLDNIDSHFDTVLAEGHGTPELTVLVEASSASAAFQFARRTIGDAGVKIKRYLPDFVTRAEIASRSGLTTQAVGNYARGQRGRSFPDPYFHVPNAVWAWGDVLSWLRAQGVEVNDDAYYPNRAETEAFMFKVWDENKVNGGWIESSPMTADIRPSAARAASRPNRNWNGYSLSAPQSGERVKVPA